MEFNSILYICDDLPLVAEQKYQNVVSTGWSLPILPVYFDDENRKETITERRNSRRASGSATNENFRKER